jgi:hypothetical protein
MSSKKCHEQAKKDQTPCKKETHVTKVVGKKTKDLNIVKLLLGERS